MKAGRDRLDNGAAVKDSRRTVGDWLAHWRATTLAVSDRKESTRELYANLSRRHLEAGTSVKIGSTGSSPPTSRRLVLAMRAKTKPGKVTEKNRIPCVRALSDPTIRQVYTVLRAGLDGAVRDGLMAKNPAAGGEASGRSPQGGQARQHGRREQAPAVRRRPALPQRPCPHRGDRVAAWRGAGPALVRHRPGRRMLVVRGTLGRVGGKLVITEPKTDRSRRTVPLSAPLVAMLRRHRANQDAERHAARDQWQDNGLVFATESGRRWIRATSCGRFKSPRRRRACPTLACTPCAISAAVAWLESGAHQGRGRPARDTRSIAITGDIYGHTSDDTARTAVEGLAEQLGLLD